MVVPSAAINSDDWMDYVTIMKIQHREVFIIVLVSVYCRISSCLYFNNFGFHPLQTFISPLKLMNNGRHCRIEIDCRFDVLLSDLLVIQIFASLFSQVFSGF